MPAKNIMFTKLLSGSIRRNIDNHPGAIKILDNIGWLFFDKILRMGGGLVITIWMARYLGIEQFGQLSFTIAFVSLFSAIAGLGLGGIVVRDIVQSPVSADILVGTAFVLQILAGILAMFLVISGVTILKPDDEFIRLMVSIVSLSLIFRAADAIKYYYEACVMSRYVIWIENGIFVVMSITRVIFITAKAPLIFFVWLTVIEAMLISLGLILLFLKSRTLLDIFKVNIGLARKLIQEAWPLLASSVAITLYMRIDLIMLEEMTNAHQVGIYAAATRLSEAWYFLPMVIVSSVSPSIIASYKDNPNLYSIKLRRLYFVMVWLALGVCVPVSLLSGSIVNILFGQEYSDAAPVLAIHLWASIAVFLGVASSQHLLVTGLLKISLYRTILGLLCNILLNYIFIPEMGAVGAAIATVISYFVSTFSIVFFSDARKHVRLLIFSPFGYPRS